MTKRALFAVAGLAFVPAVAMAQWSDNFDSYPSNASINGMTTGGPNALGTWQGWAGAAAAAPFTSTAQFLSGPNSESCTGPADNVHRYQGVNAGWWEYKANVYVPGNFTGDAYFILLNQYADAGPFNWSIEYQLNGNATGALANTFSDDYTNGTAAVSGAGNSRNGTNRALIRDRWVEIKVDFNLTTNVLQTWYDGTPVSGGSWKTNATSTLTLAAVDLFNNAGTGIFYDNLSLSQIPAPGSLAILGLGGLIAGRRRRT